MTDLLRKFRLKIRLIFWGILSLLTFWFLYLGSIPFGHIAYKINNPAGGPFIMKLSPAERLASSTDIIKIIGDPIYFSLFTPRKFESAKMTIKYKSAGVSIIEAGLMMDKIAKNYKLEPLENEILDNLAWDKITENGVTLWQKNKKFNSINEFLQTDINRDEVATYNYDLKKDFKLDNYQPSEKNLILPRLRGGYQFYAYVKDEPLKISANFSSLNSDEKPDSVLIRITDYNNREIWQKNLDQSGDIMVDLKNLAEGVYRVEIRANDEIITEKLETNLSRISFIKKIWPLDKIDLFTDSQFLSARTVNPGSLGDIKFGEQNFNINETYKKFDFSLNGSNSINKINLSQPDMILEADGVFSFALELLVNPSYCHVSANLDLNNVNYIIARYQTPEVDGDYKIATADFVLSDAYRENNKNSFMISIPGLKAEDNINDYLEIKEIKIELTGQNLFKKIYDKFKK